MDPGQDRGAEEGAGRHPEEGQGADHAQGARPVVAAEEVARGGGRDRDQGAATERLDDAGGDQLIEALGPPGQGRTDGEGDEGEEEEAPGPERVRETAGERHRGHVDEEVRVDDPGCVPELGPGGEVDDDRRKGDGRDHQLEAGEEDAGPEDGEEDDGAPAGHGESVRVWQIRTGGCGGARSRRRSTSAGTAGANTPCTPEVQVHSMGKQSGMEIERRYLLAGSPSAAELARLGARPRRLEQVYLARHDDWVRRVRKIEEAGVTHYVATRKRDLPAGTGAGAGGPAGIAREEIENELSVEEYGRLVAEADPARRVIRKVRNVIAWDDWTLELDVFSEPPGLVMLEVELEGAAEVPTLPPEIAARVIREVTSEPRYTNYGLSATLAEG